MLGLPSGSPLGAVTGRESRYSCSSPRTSSDSDPWANQIQMDVESNNKQRICEAKEPWSWLCLEILPGGSMTCQLVSMSGEVAECSGSVGKYLVARRYQYHNSAGWEKLSLLGLGCMLGNVGQQSQAARV